MAWNRNEGKADVAVERPKAGHAKRAAYAILVLLAGGAIIWFASRPETPEKTGPTPGTSRKIDAVKPQIPTNAPARRTVADVIRERGGFKNLTAADKAEIAKIRREDASRHVPRAMPPMPGANPRVKRVFECRSDQVISMVLTAGDSIPPFPGSNESLEREFVRSLNVPIVINDDDSDEVKASKQAVIDARAVIDEEMKKGRGFREILEEYRNQVHDNAKMRREVKATAGEIMRTDGVEAADQYVEKANERLKGWGISGVKRPMTHEEFISNRHQRQLDKQNKTTKEDSVNE